MEKYVDGRVDVKLEENETPNEDKLSFKLANEINVPQDRVHIYFGLMFKNLSAVSDSIGVFRKHLLPEVIRLTNQVIVGPVVRNSHNAYIDFSGESYRIRGVGSGNPYWIDDDGRKRNMAGEYIN